MDGAKNNNKGRFKLNLDYLKNGESAFNRTNSHNHMPTFKKSSYREYNAQNSFRPTLNNSYMIDENDEDDFDMIN